MGHLLAVPVSVVQHVTHVPGLKCYLCVWTVPCRTGSRTDALARHLVEQMGYTQVYNVRHGISRWIGDKNPVARN